MLSQGRTLMCLQIHLNEDLAPSCRDQILHLSSVQSENIKFDRKLYLACNTELRKFCPGVTFSQGQAYDCLMQHKFDTFISQQVIIFLFTFTIQQTWMMHNFINATRPNLSKNIFTIHYCNLATSCLTEDVEQINDNT